MSTPGQTVGPFFGLALPYDGGPDLEPPGRRDAVRLHGFVFDGDGEPVPDALLEIWQPAADGSIPAAAGSLRRDGWTFTGWGRAATDGAGHYSFSTVAPGGFIALVVFARGLLDRLHTRIYFAGDPFLDTLPADRRATLLATPDEDGYRFDVRLQGDGETVFLTYQQ